MATVSWKPDASGNWSLPSNWSAGVLPDPADTVSINTAQPHTITQDAGDDVIADLTVGDDLISVTGGTLDVLSPAVFGDGLAMSGGDLILGGGAAVTGTVSQTSGTVAIASGNTLTLAGTVQFGPYGTGEVDGPGTLSTAGTVAILEGVYLGGGLAWVNSGTVNEGSNIAIGDASGSAATLTNLAGASFDLTGDYLDIYNNSYSTNGTTHVGSLTFVNQGLLAKTGGGGTSTISTTLTNTAGGTIASDSGVLALAGGGSFGGTIDGTSQVDFTGGTSTVASTLLVTNVFNQTGGVIDVATGATLTLAGTAQFGPYGTGEVDGPGTLSTTGTAAILEGVYLGGGLACANSGTVNDSSNIAVGDASGATATLTNLAGASFNLTGDYLYIYNNSYSSSGTAYVGTLTFVNQGLLAKTGGGGTSTISTTLTNTAGGTIASNSGVLALAGGGSFGGVINGTGQVDFTGGTSTVSSTLLITDVFNQTGGVIDVATGATLTLAGTAQFGPYGVGDADGPGTLSTTGTTTIEENVYIGGGLSWSNSGTVNDSNQLYIGDASGGTATLTNLAGASFDLTGDYLTVADATTSSNGTTHVGALTFVNQGMLAKTGGTGTSTISTTLTNSSTGTVVAADGTLLLTGAIDNEGVLEGLGGSNLDVTGTLTGGGYLGVGYAGKVELGTATGESVVFAGPGTLQLDAPASFTGTVYGLTAGDRIVLGGQQAVSTSVTGSVLHVGLSGGGSLTLAVAGLHATGDLTLSNNTLTATTTLGQATPDLVVAGVTAPATALAGEPLAVTWTDTNQGLATATGPWTDEVFVASDAAGDDAQLLGTLSYAGTLGANQSVTETLDVTLPAATSGSEYFLVKTDALSQVAGDGVGPQRQGITGTATTLIPTAVPATPLSITGVTPDGGSNLGTVTVTLEGGQFNADETVAVVAPDGTTRDAGQVAYVGSGTLWATFDLQGLATGGYTVEVSDATRSSTLSDAFQVSSGPTGQVAVNLVLPEYINQGQSGIGTITYANTGDTDAAAPVLEVSSTQALLQDASDTTATGSLLLLGTNPAGPAGILQPGTQGSLTFTYTPTTPTAQGDVSIALGVVGSTSTITSSGSTGETYTPDIIVKGLPIPGTSTAVALAPVSSSIDWSSLESTLQPPTVDATDWNNVYTQFVARVGTTTGSLDAALSQEATELAQVGQPTGDVATLLQDELFQASGALAGTYLDDATDISPTGSGLSLSLDRFYDGTLLERDAAGAFGDGWTSTYDVTAVTGSDGTIYVQGPGILHVFTPGAGGTYTAQTGDAATLTLSGGLFRMNDGSGTVDQFRADGKLGSITDASGNTVTLAYGGNGVLQQVTSLTTGETITFTLNAAGRITGAADSDGRTVTYTYDATGTHLLSATGPGGTTTYTYAVPTGSAQDNALTSITNPDGTQQTFTYDAAGRLATQAGTGGAGLETYTYPGSNEVAITDALGNTTTLLYGADGTVEQTQDALGNVTQLQSNAAGELTGVVTAGGSTSSYAYDALGNLTSAVDPLGGTVTGTYASGTQDLTGFTDQRGDTTQYSYDAAGNVTGITYVDGSGDTYVYGPTGLLTSSTDADGNTTQYGYDAAGDLTSKSFSDGTLDTYAYDAQGDLTAQAASGYGTTSYTYDQAGRLTSVTTPQGQVESYTYDAQGQLASRTLPGDVVTQYGYDADGRLTTLQDGSGNLLVHYTYDAAGELARTDDGNGASTTHSYDANGNVTQILNLNADGSTASYYDYTYNANGQVVADATSDGLWSYGYDGEGELTNAVFQSTNSTVQNQNISYSYDAAGNRTSQTINGTTTAYTTDSLNQYTSIGGTTYSYDAAGNTTSETDSSGTTTFTYNEANQLTSETGPSGTYQYVYDALGNLVSETQNGVISNYVNDPLSLSVSGQPLTSIAQLGGSEGTGQETYEYGLGLAAINYAVGNTSYVDTDLSGNVTGLSGPNGKQSVSYFYLPFGQVTQTNGTASEPFELPANSAFQLLGR